MEIRKDFKELLALLNAHQVDYVIVSGYALAQLGVPRYTGDIDILIRLNPENAEKMMSALDEFGFGSVGLSADDFTQPEQVIQLGYPPNRIDIINTLTGVASEEVFANKIIGDYDGLEVPFINRQQFIMNKRAIGRLKDLADLEALGEL